MTRKDYILIARALRTTLEAVSLPDWPRPNWRPAVQAAASNIAVELSRDNPRFDSNHFLAVVRGEKLLTSRPPR